MFIAVTLPHGTAYLRADRIESVMPIRQNPAHGDNQLKTMITMIGGEESDWWIAEDADTIMCDINWVMSCSIRKTI